jgi:hypothetical protein
MHPSVIALQQQVDALSQPSPELAALRADERALMAQIVAPPPRPTTPAPSTPTLATLLQQPATPAAAARQDGTVDAGAAASASAALPALPLGQLDRDGPLQLAQSRLASAIRSYEDAMGKIDEARVELDIRRAAYKHRYTVITPAEVPKKPKKATAQLIGVGSVVGALLLAFLLAAGLDLLGGSILETWQVRRRLKLDVLGEFDRPA